MKKLLIVLTAATMACTGALAATDTDGKTAKKPAAKKAAVASKSKKAAPKKGKLRKALKVNPLTGASAPAAPLPQGPGVAFPATTPAVFTGVAHCEFGTTVSVTQDGADQFSYKVSTNKGHSYNMRQVPTTTGVMRLEDKAAGATWLQLGNKSMLMDQKRGERVATECRNTQQAAREEELKKAPPPNLLN